MVENAWFAVSVCRRLAGGIVSKKMRGLNKGLEIDGHPWAMMAIYDASLSYSTIRVA